MGKIPNVLPPMIPSLRKLANDRGFLCTAVHSQSVRSHALGCVAQIAAPSGITVFLGIIAMPSRIA